MSDLWCRQGSVRGSVRNVGTLWVHRLDMLEKNRIRERMRAERRKVAPSVRQSASQVVCARILSREDVKGAVAAKQPFAVYLKKRRSFQALWAF